MRRPVSRVVSLGLLVCACSDRAFLGPSEGAAGAGAAGGASPLASAHGGLGEVTALGGAAGAAGGGAVARAEAGSAQGGAAAQAGAAELAAVGGGAGAPPLEPVAPCGELRSQPEFAAEACLEEGSFQMGSDEANLGSGFFDHTPLHRVRLSAFALDRYEVTVQRFAVCVEAGACSEPGRQGQPGCTYEPSESSAALPVTCVDWQQAATFCEWDGGRRLPTEAEWEYAARSSASWSYPWGDLFACDRAAVGGGGYCPQNAGGQPAVVGGYPSGDSPEGIHDLAGNVAEWVSDRVAKYPSDAVVDPAGGESGQARGLRGGSWLLHPVYARGFVRVAVSQASSGNWGFRCARNGQ